MHARLREIKRLLVCLTSLIKLIAPGSANVFALRINALSKMRCVTLAALSTFIALVAGSNTFAIPNSFQNVTYGDSVNLTWTPTTRGTVSLRLFLNSTITEYSESDPVTIFGLGTLIAGESFTKVR